MTILQILLWLMSTTRTLASSPSSSNNNNNKLRIAFWTGYSGDWSGQDKYGTTSRGPVYGAEQALMNVAEVLAQQQELYESIEVYVSQDVDYELRGVHWRHQNTLTQHRYDVMVVSRYTNYFLYHDARAIANRTFVWVHDTYPLPYFEHKRLPDLGKAFNRNLDAIVDGWIAVSHTLKRSLVDKHSMRWDKIAVIPNGISKEDIDIVERATTSTSSNNDDDDDGGEIPVRVTNLFVYSTGPDRGLSVVLDMFPKITKILPNATLSIYYKKSDDSDLLRKVLAQPNVDWVGKVPHNKLMEIFTRADYWIYPGMIYETHCIMATETALAGTLQLTSTTAALGENVRGVPVPGTPGSPEFENRLLDWIKYFDKHPQEKERVRERAREWAVQQTWDNRAKLWHELFVSDAYLSRMTWNITYANDPSRWLNAPMLKETHGNESNPIAVDSTNKVNSRYYEFRELDNDWGKNVEHGDMVYASSDEL